MLTGLTPSIQTKKLQKPRMVVIMFDSRATSEENNGRYVSLKGTETGKTATRN